MAVRRPRIYARKSTSSSPSKNHTRPSSPAAHTSATGSDTIYISDWLVCRPGYHQPHAQHQTRRPQRSTGFVLGDVAPVLVLPGLERYSQAASGSKRRRSSHLQSASVNAEQEQHQEQHLDNNDPFQEDSSNFYDEIQFIPDPDAPRARLNAAQKRANQARKWTEDVIPSLISPYLSYLHQSASLRHPADPSGSNLEPNVCSNWCQPRNLAVTCVMFDRLEIITRMTCPCSTTPMQLLARGLFPCAPIAPTLAVDLRVLNFVKLLFVRTSPNMTAWCDILETFLSNLGHKLTTKVQYMLLQHNVH
ncbi:hypothetical protein BJ138DRAFT_1118720 [Hygrophoropsis aurantiaca]|uniref:Uncharacterized protein n=1 Tax=Hygrophoropsis aurantiaca TaxID=72124 RepID=A0ACB7ZWL0_9AGAM|nr:hypothetical protein BJ138DRAFT_1118720 [Hygrophoropsis aurantiaca]